jgi:uncharacterized membrane protein
MLTHQLFLSLWFYLIFTACAGIGLVFTIKIFPKSFNLAYFLAKPLGLAVFGLVIWLLASLKILNYQNNLFIYSVFILSVLGGFIYAIKSIYKTTPSEERIKFLKYFIALEIFSLALYIGYLVLRSYNPAAYGTERFMDMMLLNASLKTQSFPFVDAWYGGKVVNYYYYGHYLVSLLTKLSGLNSFLTYSFALGLLYTVSFVLPGLLVYEISKSKWFGALAGFLVTTAGSLFYTGCVISAWLKGNAICSYASSTRLYTPSYIINEVPSYSFTVGDLHAHFLALPFFIMNLVLIYALAKSEKISKILSVGLLIGLATSALVNPSDVTTLAALLTFLWLYKVYQLYKNLGSVEKLFKSLDFRPWLYLAIFLIFGITVLTLPFLLNFKSPVLGFGWDLLYASKHNLLFAGFQYPTPILALLGMWGLYVAVIAGAVYFLRKDLRNYLFLSLLFITSIFLIIFVEVFFVKDIYHIANPAYFRANTVFKYGYHTWAMLSISFCAFLALVFAKLLENKIYRSLAGSLKVLLVIFFCLSLFYPYQAIVQFYLNSTGQLTLDSAQFINKESGDDLNTINWLNKNTNGRPVVLEAVGDSYTYFGRISVFTGNITPMGWKTHEWTWRFEGAEATRILAKDPSATVETGYGKVAKVGDDVAQIYQSPSLELTQILLKQYSVSYVYIGNQERNTYRALDEQKFAKIGQLVFQSGASKLFKVR